MTTPTPATTIVPPLTDAMLTPIARVAHEANGSYCATLGDFSQTSWDDAPDWQRSSAIEGVRAIVEGRVKAPADSHASWYEHKLQAGWAYGATKDVEARLHPCMVPFDQLAPEQQAKDRLFFAVVRALL